MTSKIILADENPDGFDNLEFRDHKIVSPIPESKPTFFIELEDRMIVQFWSTKDIDERNVFAFGEGGKVLWQVEKYNMGSNSGHLFRNPYTSLRVDPRNGRIRLNTWLEMPAYVDPETGKIERLPGRFEEGGEY